MCVCLRLKTGWVYTSDTVSQHGHACVHISPSGCMGALTPRGSIVSMLVSIATGELHLSGSLGLKKSNVYLCSSPPESKPRTAKSKQCPAIRAALPAH